MSAANVVAASSGNAFLLPDPEPRPVRYTIISVDDHLVEPPDMFDGRLPTRLQSEAPRVVETPEGHEVWEFDGNRYSQPGANAVAGQKRDRGVKEPCRFEQMRPGCWDIDARVRDMDINGVWASLNFPSMITGFSGRVYSAAKDPELGLAVTRAFNDWVYECWWQPYPDRIIPLGITYLADPDVAAGEVRRNAERGFRSLTLPERPHRLGFPSIFTGYWDPVLAACEETETVISLHVGSSGLPSDFAPEATVAGLSASLFGQLSLTACAEWIWSAVPVRFPGIKIALSEGGIGWVAMLLDRLENIVERSGYGKDFPGDLTPAEVLHRNFWFCTIDDPKTIVTREAIGVDKIMVEVDYPHGDTTWPDTQEIIHRVWGALPVDDLRKMTHLNAAELFRWALPEQTYP
ncbi:MAG: amidohydrolase family protein [Acidimicrobiales bacterium]